ncbi:hypothetical protein FOA52_000799 [Chlamydomonas sp. UWO 241]|nr:hypothetical protein FOA52_000799 [Chlamydomonas sp. UWO 241]
MASGWILGAVINVIGNIMVNLGQNIMKLGFNKRDAMEEPEEKKPSIVKFRAWQIGMTVFIIGNVLNFASFAFAAQSLLAALGSVQFIANVIFAATVLKEKVTIMIITATGLIIGGCLMLVFFGDQSSTVYTVEELMDLYRQPLYVIYLVMCVVAFFGFYIVYLHGKQVARTPGREGSGWVQVLPLAYSLFSAIVGTQAVIFCKSLSTLLRATLAGDNQLGNWYTWVTLLCFIIAAGFWTVRLNKGLRMFPVMVIVPMLQICWVLGSIISGLLYFEEYQGFTALSGSMFVLGILIVLAGVYLITLNAKRQMALNGVELYDEMLSTGKSSGDSDVYHAFEGADNPTYDPHGDPAHGHTGDAHSPSSRRHAAVAFSTSFKGVLMPCQLTNIGLASSTAVPSPNGAHVKWHPDHTMASSTAVATAATSSGEASAAAAAGGAETKSGGGASSRPSGSGVGAGGLHDTMSSAVVGGSHAGGDGGSMMGTLKKGVGSMKKGMGSLRASLRNDWSIYDASLNKQVMHGMFATSVFSLPMTASMLRGAQSHPRPHRHSSSSGAPHEAPNESAMVAQLPISRFHDAVGALETITEAQDGRKPSGVYDVVDLSLLLPADAIAAGAATTGSSLDSDDGARATAAATAAVGAAGAALGAAAATAADDDGARPPPSLDLVGGGVVGAPAALKHSEPGSPWSAADSHPSSGHDDSATAMALVLAAAAAAAAVGDVSSAQQQALQQRTSPSGLGSGGARASPRAGSPSPLRPGSSQQQQRQAAGASPRRGAAASRGAASQQQRPSTSPSPGASHAQQAADWVPLPRLAAAAQAAAASAAAHAHAAAALSGEQWVPLGSSPGQQQLGGSLGPHYQRHVPPESAAFWGPIEAAAELGLGQRSGSTWWAAQERTSLSPCAPVLQGGGDSGGHDRDRDRSDRVLLAGGGASAPAPVASYRLMNQHSSSANDLWAAAAAAAAAAATATAAAAAASRPATPNSSGGLRASPSLGVFSPLASTRASTPPLPPTASAASSAAASQPLSLPPSLYRSMLQSGSNNSSPDRGGGGAYPLPPTGRPSSASATLRPAAPVAIAGMPGGPTLAWQEDPAAAAAAAAVAVAGAYMGSAVGMGGSLPLGASSAAPMLMRMGSAGAGAVCECVGMVWWSIAIHTTYNNCVVGNNRDRSRHLSLQIPPNHCTMNRQTERLRREADEVFMHRSSGGGATPHTRHRDGAGSPINQPHRSPVRRVQSLGGGFHTLETLLAAKALRSKVSVSTAAPIEVVAAIDQGTQSTRVYLFDVNQQPVAHFQVPLSQIKPQPGWCEHDPLEIWRGVQECMEGAINSAQLEVGPVEVKAVGITNQRETTLVWHRKTGQPLFNAIVWSDMRTTELCNTMAADLPGGINHFREKTGLPISTYFSSFKFKWMYENVDDVKRAVDAGDACFGTVDSWIIYMLTGGAQGGGVHVTDVSNAARTGLMDLATCAWDPELCTTFGVTPHCLPRIVSNAEVYGHVAKFPFEGVPISGCIADQHAAMLGQRCVKGEAKNTYGTGAFLMLNTGSDVVHSSHGLLTTVAYRLGPSAETQYALEGAIAVAGRGVSWLVENLGIAADPEELIATYTAEERLAKSVDSTSGVYFVPAFSGLLAPRWDSSARGALLGLTSFSTKAHIARAMLEAICFQSREVLEAMQVDAQAAGLGKITVLRVDGGASQNGLLMQTQADVLQVPVRRPAFQETTALGAALAAGIGIGMWTEKDVMRSHAYDSTDFRPNIGPKRAAERFEKWNIAVEHSFQLARLEEERDA